MSYIVFFPTQGPSSRPCSISLVRNVLATMARGKGERRSRRDDRKDGGPKKRGKVRERFTGGYLPPPHVYKALYGEGRGDGLLWGIGETARKAKCDTVFTPFNKGHYTPTHETASRPLKKVEGYRRSHKIKLSGNNIPNPIITFEEANLPGFLMEEFQRSGYKAPTPIQAQGWPIALSGRDLVGVAQRSSGKTLAYLLPAFMHIKNQPRVEPGEGPIVICLAPTRELAKQVHEVATQFGKCFGVRSACVYGGVPKTHQLLVLSSAIDILVATPRRLVELFNIRGVNFRRTSFLVLDDAGKMLDLGSERQIRRIVGQIRPDRQTLMLSAAWSKGVRKLAENSLRRYAHVDVGFLKLSTRNPSIRQVVEVCNQSEKDEKLFKLLEEIPQNSEDRTIIFCEKEMNSVDELSRRIRRMGSSSTAIHKDKSQHERNAALRLFKSGMAKNLVVTDEAARGLELEGVNVVINFDFPSSIEDYVHRIKRTGRWNRNGTAYTFFTKNDADHAKALIGVLTEAKQVVSPELLELESKVSCSVDGFEVGA